MRLFTILLIYTLNVGHFMDPTLLGADVNPSTYKPDAFSESNRAPRVEATAASIEEIFREFADSNHTPGLVYGVVLDGQLLYSGSFGYTNLETRKSADARSLFRIASMSKSVTAVAILQLRDAGKLNLDDPVSNYVPEMKNIQYLTSDAPEITIRHLLTHGAGFPEDNPWGDRQLANSDEELRHLLKNGISFSNTPGVAYEYSNLGFAILGLIVQEASGKEFQEYTSENIFSPLQMNSTVWEYERASQQDLALGYDWIDESHQNIPLEHHGSFGPMGGLITSIEDFANYVAMHLAAWPPRNDADMGPLKRSSLREMQHPWRFSGLNTDNRDANESPCPSVSAYAYGLSWSKDCDGKVYVGHSGGLPGFGSNWAMMPAYGLAVLSFDNATYRSTSAVNRTVLNTIIAEAGLEPRTTSTSEILEQRKNQLVELLPDWEGAESSGIFAENFFLDNRTTDLIAQTEGLFEEAGPITNTGRIIPVNQLRGTFTLHGEKENIDVFFTLTPEQVPLIQKVKMNAVAKPER